MAKKTFRRRRSNKRLVRRKTNSKGRDYTDPQYLQWRKDVYERDNFCCQWPNCRSKMDINAHHIKRWSKYPGLRFVVSNGITLCKRHHDFIHNKEEQYEALFYSLLKLSMLNKLRELRGEN